MTADSRGDSMTDPNQRRMNWQIKTDTSKVKQILDDRRPDMLKRYEAAVASLCEMEVKARQTLNAAGVHTIFYVAYLNYARQLYKLSRQQGISGESFALQAQVLLDKWSNRGLDPAVLARIRTEVFDAAAPTP
jgi:Asp-tRNA(Asn)/Glu-tRNA(Gln) amidotransferase A subunit family amidase